MTIANNRDIFEVTPEQSLGFRNNWKYILWPIESRKDGTSPTSCC